MEGNTVVQCGKDARHAISLRAKRCRECRCGLWKMCSGCSKLVSYSNHAKHAKKCTPEGASNDNESSVEEQPKEEDDFSSPLRIGYLASQWNFDEGVMPAGQYRFSVCDNFPEHFKKLVLNGDPTGEETVHDAYDALWGTIFAQHSDSFELMHTFESLEEVLEAGTELLQGLDVVVLGNWAHPTALQDETNGSKQTMELYHKLEELEIANGVRIFPPLDYVWYFSRKVHYYNKLSSLGSLLAAQSAYVIPTMAVPTSRQWKKQLKEFANRNATSELMLKREMSEMRLHTKAYNVTRLPSSLAGRENGFHWMAQPVLQEFKHEPEFRMYVVNGKCQWGVSTHFVGNDDDKDGGVTLEKTACAPGRATWEAYHGGKEAASVAEHVASIICKDMVHASMFIRVDMVKRRDGGWWINELEYFGNAFIHFEAFDNASEFLGTLTTCMSRWLQDLVSRKVVG